MKMTSKNANAGKRTRATNFSFAEKELLLKYVIENNHILENEESSAVSWKDKNDCWVKISELYNSTTTGCPRDATSLRLKYEGIKKLLRKSKCEIFKTRGGPYTNDYTNFSEFEKQLFDSDATEYNNGDASENMVKIENNCQASTSGMSSLLDEKKLELVELQKSILIQEHEENMGFLKTKHALELKSLELDIFIKKQKLDNKETY